MATILGKKEDTNNKREKKKKMKTTKTNLMIYQISENKLRLQANEWRNGVTLTSIRTFIPSICWNKVNALQTNITWLREEKKKKKKERKELFWW